MKRGFTLIELMIVVVVIGILAAIAIPKFNDVSESAKRNACRANMRTIACQEVIFFTSYGYFTDAQGDLGLNNVVCPGCDTPHDITVEAFLAYPSASYTIDCPNAISHGIIANGIASWTNFE